MNMDLELGVSDIQWNPIIMKLSPLQLQIIQKQYLNLSQLDKLTNRQTLMYYYEHWFGTGSEWYTVEAHGNEALSITIASF